MGEFINARVVACAITVICAAAGTSRAQLVPNGGEFLINQYTSANQTEAAVAADAAGNFVVTWMSYLQDGSGYCVVARRYDSAGAPIGGEFQVNSYTTGYQYQPDVAMSPAGKFVIVWNSQGQDGSGDGIFAQRYDSTGAPQGTELQVNAWTTGDQSLPQVAVGTSDNFLIVWTAPDGDQRGIFARRFDSSGAAQGTEFLVHGATTGDQRDGAVAGGPNGFVVVWSDPYVDGSSNGVVARRYDTDGLPVGTEFVVNSYTTSAQAGGTVTIGPAGDFVVVWTGYFGQDGEGRGLFGQRFDSTGVRLGSEFRVNADPAEDQSDAAVAIGAAGEFVTAWNTVPYGGGVVDIYGRAFTSTGAPNGGDLLANAFTTNTQSSPDVVFLGEGYLMVWHSFTQDGDGYAITARRFMQAGVPTTGKKLLIRTPSTPSKNKLVFLSRDVELEAPQGIEQDPRCAPLGSGSLASGARLRVVGDGGDFTIDLPCVNWSANGAQTTYKYRDASGATCSVIIIKTGKLLKAICKGSQVAYALGSPQSDVHLTLSTGDPSTNRKYCATFGPLTAATVVDDGSGGQKYKALAAGPGVCQ